MKLLMENWRKYLTEAELKYSETLFDFIFKIAVNALKTDSEGTKKLDVPGKEIFYLDKPKIKNGAALYFIIHGNTGMPWQEGIEFFKNKWDPKSGAPEQILENFLKQPLEMKLFIEKDFESLGAMGADEKNGIYLILNPWEHSTIDLLKSTVRHELQHLTQRLNSYALKYGEELFKANGDTSQIQKLNLRFKKDFGTGKQKTGLRQISKKQAREQGISDDERTKRYLGDDFEYETWMSDMLDDLVRWLFKKEFLKPMNLKIAAFKEQNPNMLNEENNMAARKNIIAMAKNMNMKPMELIKIYKSSSSLNQLATRYAKHVLTDDHIMSEFAKDSNMRTYVKAIKTLLKLRPKEFAGDFTKNLELRLRKMAETS
jgi:hypothetical protein